ncbi:zinc metalloproteinase nas-14-like [Uranotaenia lowii]|uniref:zinc metalloproteinase nas-14-like n=1 Tax=Uranotaenia lowii TaxID=190385 RepID=UPI002479BB1D|nr:zinc metalloproteinase nas-14-like [Uranotaenia lowii]
MLFLVLLLHVGLTLGFNYFETHIDQPNRNARNALSLAAYKWPDGIVPYVFHEDECDLDYRARILDSMNVIQQSSCVHFIPKTDDQLEHIRFRKSSLGCGSSIGYRPGQSEPLDVVYDDFCLSLPGAIQHELLHVLGLFHEHTRPDRDDYVEILWDNIEPEFRKNFAKGSYDYMETFDLPYDYNSVMHYPRYAFARPGTSVTMISRMDPDTELGQVEGATILDLEKVRLMYDCIVIMNK